MVSIETGRARKMACWLVSSTVAITFLASCSKPNRAPVYTRSISNQITPLKLTDKGPKFPSYNKSMAEPNSLREATNYWGKQFDKNPQDAQIALNYVKNLKAMGSNAHAIGVLGQAYRYNPDNLEIASIYGRMALASGNINLASKLLKKALAADDSDPKLLSALGTIQAKLGNYGEAQHYYDKALAITPKNATMMNNLALAYALDGKPEAAETVLRKASKFATGRAAARVRQNLSLVLSLQGKYDEATTMAKSDVSTEAAQKNISYLKKMFRAPAAQKTTRGYVKNTTRTAMTTSSIQPRADAANERGPMSIKPRKIDDLLRADADDLQQLKESGTATE